MKDDIIFLLITICFSAFGQLLLKYSVIGMGGINFKNKNIFTVLLHIFTNGWILLGLLLFSLSMILWLKVISNMELSRAYPSVSLSYVIVFIFSIFLFGEGVTFSKVAGIISIIIGVFLLQR